MDGYIALKHPALGNLFCASELRQDARLLARPAAGFATVPVAGRDCVELEHADRAAEKTAMAVNRGRFTVPTFHERSAMGVREGTARGNGSPANRYRIVMPEGFSIKVFWPAIVRIGATLPLPPLRTRRCSGVLRRMSFTQLVDRRDR